MDFILNDIVPLTPRSLVLDDFIVNDYEPSVAGDVFWRWEDEPTSDPQFLGTQTAGATLAVPFDLMGRAIRFFLVGRTAAGVHTVLDVREAVQTVFTPDPTLGLLTDLGIVLTDGGNVLWN